MKIISTPLAGAFLSILTLFSFSFVLAPSAEESSPPDMKLNQLLQQAIDNNPDLKAAEKLWEAAKARVPQAKALDDPQIRVMWESISGGQKNSFHPNSNTFRLSQTIPFPGKRDLRGAIAQTESEVAKAQYDAKKREVIAEVKRAYYDLIFAYKAVEINQIHIGHLRQLETISRTRFAVGLSPLSDALRVQMELSRRLNNDITLEQEKEVVSAKINALINRPLNSPIEVASEIPKPKLNYSTEAIGELALQNRLELQAAKLGIKRGKLAYDLAKKQYYPDFMPMVDRMPMGQGSGQWMFMLSINLPFFFKGKYDSGVEEAKAGIDASESTYENLKNQVFLELQTLITKLQTGERTAELYRTTLIPQSEATLKAARQAYENGKSDFSTVIDSLMVLENSKLEYYRSLTLFQRNFADLERAVGTVL